MNKQYRKVILYGLASQALAVTTMFTILIGLIPTGTHYLPAFAGTAAALLLVAMLIYRRNELAERQKFLIGGAVTLALGVAAMVWIDASQLLVPLLIFGGLGVFLLLRMSQTVDDMRYIRQSLLSQYKLDLQLIVGFILYTVFFGEDTSWQSKMVPFFVLFLFLRMTALSVASRMERGVKGANTRMEKLQNNLPVFFIGFILVAGWIMNTLGVPVVRWLVGIVLTIVEPIFYYVGYVVEYLVNLLKAYGDPEGTKQKIEDMKEANGEPPPEEFFFTDDGSHLFNETTLFVMSAIGLLILIIYFLRRMKRAQQLQAAVGIVEMREFIHTAKPKKGQAAAVLASGNLTPMRKAYRRFLLSMKKAGYTRGTGETASEYIDKIATAQPNLQASMQELTDFYMEERYGARSVDDKLPRAEALSQKLTDGDKTK
ncbi:uncharacterized protein DUF4129 [Tumebacillus sp. BK434]|uniref:DUF4129 domain-containing protein n=1 Tax=Tumebacillus sp. BK434 TaxID=2512169 RepID=UPI001043B69F|nr:DUF4129 domain-containing protein [Tumebacillus sp. BK434]TCP54607.1 uncharacterized protein DUF4129 [Tumebacillus sp. BK434]